MATANPFTSAQAPSVMNLIAPDLAVEQQQLSRQQLMADLLRKQAMEPAGNTEVINGWAVKKNPLEGFSKMAQALMANKSQDDIEQRQLALSKALSEKMGGAFDSMAGGSTQPAPQAENRQDPGAMGPQTPGPAAPLQGVQAPVPQPTASPQIAAIRNQAKAAYLMGNTDLANKLLANISTLTDGAKTNMELGIGTPEARQFEIAKRQKEGTMALLPGQTNVLPTGERIVAPNFETGVAGGFDAQGRPIANEVTGSAQIAANRAGGIKRAEAGVADVFATPAPVDAAGGRVALTPAQQRAAANNGVDPANPRTPSPTAPRAADADQALIYNGEMKQAQDRLAAAKTPEERTRAQADIDGLTRETKRLGIKLQDDSSRKFGEQVASKSAESLLESRDKSKIAADALIGIQKARGAIAGGVFQGSGAETKLAISKFINANIPGVNIDPQKVSDTDYLKSTLGASLLAEAKTLGSNPSNADASRINDIVGSIAKDPGAMTKILDWRQEMAERAIQTHNSTVDDAEKRGMTSPYDLRIKAPSSQPAAPSTGGAKTQTFNSLPNPAEFNGKRMRAPDGSVIRSNGKTWVKE